MGNTGPGDGPRPRAKPLSSPTFEYTAVEILAVPLGEDRHVAWDHGLLLFLRVKDPIQIN